MLLVALLMLILSCVHASDVHESLRVYQPAFTRLMFTSHIMCILGGVWGVAKYIAFMSCCCHPELLQTWFYAFVAAENA